MTRQKGSGSLALAAGAACISLALAACGGGNGDDASAAGERSDRQAKFREVAARHAACMRENGVDVPDPKPGQRGIVIAGPGAKGDPAAMRRAERKCKKLLEDLPDPPQLSKRDEREFRERALKHARCMRGQGVDFPDPAFGPGGRVQMRLPGGVRPDDASFRAAQEKCSATLPGGGLRFEGPGR